MTTFFGHAPDTNHEIIIEILWFEWFDYFSKIQSDQKHYSYFEKLIKEVLNFQTVSYNFAKYITPHISFCDKMHTYTST